MNDITKVIKIQGIDVRVIKDSFNSYITKMLFGKQLTTMSNSSLMIESNRKGHFLPDIDIDCGYIIDTGYEKLLITGMYNEMFKNEIIDIITHMVICNCSMQVYNLYETADEYGNITKELKIKHENVYGYVKIVDETLRKYEPGLHLESNYLIYLPALGYKLLDNFEITFDENITRKIQVLTIDEISYKGLALIEAKNETRSLVDA